MATLDYSSLGASASHAVGGGISGNPTRDTVPTSAVGVSSPFLGISAYAAIAKPGRRIVAISASSYSFQNGGGSSTSQPVQHWS